MTGPDDETGEIALYGGSFDPPHMGHVYVIAHVLATEPVDGLWLVPAYSHAFGKSMASFTDRVRMCELAAEVFGSRVLVSRVEEEIRAGDQPSYTVDTLEHLCRLFPKRRFALVVGSDNLGGLTRWKDADRIRELVRLVVVGREGYATGDAGASIPDISSTLVRRRLAAGEDVTGLVPIEIARLCEERGFYRGS